MISLKCYIIPIPLYTYNLYTIYLVVVTVVLCYLESIDLSFVKRVVSLLNVSCLLTSSPRLL
jgi:hypothetical protein